jgi:hypothetical protein
VPYSGSWYGGKYYFGLHYDLHAGSGDTELGKNLKPAELAASLKRMNPDFVQTDCKGHPGQTSWFSKTPNATVSPGVVKDAMKGWRDATRKLGLPLHCHYSGIWDCAAAKKHPEWAVVPSPKLVAEAKQKNPAAPLLTSEKMCPRSGYLEGLLIPQMLELIDRYEVDGFWVDGDMWAVEACYCERCRQEFTKRTGIKEPPQELTDPTWPAWINFHHDSFNEYVTKYCDAVHKHKPGVKVCSNWIQTFKNPGEPLVPTDWISGDNSHVWGYDSSRCEARFISTRGKPWDIMLWAFYCSHGFGSKDSPWHFKPPQMLMQEAAISLAYGGNIQIYEHPAGLRDGRLASWRMDRLGQVGKFVKERRAVCQDTQTIPQVAVLLSENHLYAQPVNNLHWGYDADGVKGAVFSLLEHSLSVDIYDEWALMPHISEFPVVVAPEQDKMSDEMVTVLKRYVEQGGRLLVTGAASLDRFGTKFLGIKKAEHEKEKSYFVPAGDGNFQLFSKTWALVTPGTAKPLGMLGNSCLLDDKLTDYPAATVNRAGKGLVAYVPFDLFHDFQHNRYPLARVFVGELIDALKPKLAIRVKAPVCVDVILRRKGGKTIVNLINRSSGIPNNPDSGAIDDIPPVGPVVICMDVESKPKKVEVKLEDGKVSWKYAAAKSGKGRGIVTAALSHVTIHTAVVIE